MSSRRRPTQRTNPPARKRQPRVSGRRPATGGRLLTGGARRRRPWPAAALAGLVVLVCALVGVALVDGGEDDARSPEAARPAVEAAPAPERGDRRRNFSNDRLGGGDEASRFALDVARPDSVRLLFVRKPRAGLMFDVRSGRVLWRLNPTRRVAIASLTKMMTALVMVEREDPHDRVRITKRAVTTAGSGVGVLPRGKKVQLEALLNGLLLVSGNDASVALALHTAGSVRGFVRLMNRRATELGLFSTHFSTPHGLLDRGNYSSAVDLAVLARADLAERRIRRIARRDRAIVKFPIKGGRLFLYNNNPLIRSGYKGTTGLKTGYTSRAGRSIVATVKRGRVELGVVLLDSYNPAEQARKLFKRGLRAVRSGRLRG
jgi:serine-type D-Ala-D-Ala carboxypeptidase (penicillin-binding protein 5/6)